jgi:hypothetical protein
MTIGWLALAMGLILAGMAATQVPRQPQAVARVPLGAEAWSEAIPGARLVSEEPGESPLAWQGGRLSRVIADFCEQPEVLRRRASA